MRILTIIAALAASTLLGGWSFRSAGPLLPERSANTMNCGYPNLEACVVTTRGAGGYCYPNPKYVEERRHTEPRPASGRRHASCDTAQLG